MTKALIPLADGVEEMEAVIVIDMLRRAQWEVVAAGLAGNKTVKASRNVTIVADTTWDAVDPGVFDVLIIPGGATGVENLMRDKRILDAVRLFNDSKRWLGAVCAGPLVLQEAGVLAGRRITCHPAVHDKLRAAPRLPERVVVDGKLVTSQGAGTCFEFALTFVRLIDGTAKAKSLMQAIVLTAGG